MSWGNIRQLEAVERRGPELFLLAGLLVAGHGAVNAVEAFTSLTPPPDVFAPAGYLIAVIGMVALYPALVDRSPKLARTAVLVAIIPAVGWISILALTTGELLGIASNTVTPGPFLAIHIVGLLATYLLFAGASLRSDLHSNAVGGLLLIPPLLIVAMFASAAVIGNSTVGAFLVGIGQAVAHLSIGVALPDRSTATVDSATSRETIAD